MENVMNFITWALKRAKKSTVPSKAVLTIDRGLVGSEGEAEYLWGTSGRTVTEALLDARWKSYYKPHGWTETDYKEITDGWVAKKKRVADCQGLLDWYLGNDTNANGNYKNYCTDKGLCAAISRPYVVGRLYLTARTAKRPTLAGSADLCLTGRRWWWRSGGLPTAASSPV